MGSKGRLKYFFTENHYKTIYEAVRIDRSSYMVLRCRFSKYGISNTCKLITVRTGKFPSHSEMVIIFNVIAIELFCSATTAVMPGESQITPVALSRGSKVYVTRVTVRSGPPHITRVAKPPRSKISLTNITIGPRPPSVTRIALSRRTKICGASVAK